MYTPSQPGTYQFGQWTIEPDLNRIISGDVQKRLEPKVLDVLCYLLDHPGETVSQHALLEGVWPGRMVEPSAVTRNIGLIRRALNDDPRNPTYIATIPKRGYQTVAPVSARPPAHGYERRTATSAEHARGTDADVECLLRETLADIFEKSPMFRGMDRDLVDHLSSIASLKRYQKDQVVFEEDSPADGLYAVVSGSIRVVQNNGSDDAEIKGTLHAGDSGGELGLIDGAPRVASFVACEATTVCFLGRSEFLALLSREPALFDPFLSIIGGALRRLLSD